MSDDAPISIVVISSERYPRKDLLDSQLVKSGIVSQIVFVSPLIDPTLPSLNIAIATKDPHRPVTLDLVFCPWGRRNQARNRGAAAASNNILYFLDEDVLPAPAKAVERCLGEFRDSDLVWISGPYLSEGSRISPDFIYNFLANTWAQMGEHGICHFLAGNVLTRKDAWTWPESLTTGGEELEIHLQLVAQRKRGLLTKELVAIHQPGKSWRDLFHRLQQHETCQNHHRREAKRHKLLRWVWASTRP